MNLILFENPTIRQNLLPFTFTRPVAAIRTGILTIAEKWEKHFASTPSFSTEAYLSKKFLLTHTSDNLWINGALCPDANLVNAIRQLRMGDALVKDQMILAVRTADDEVPEVIVGKVTVDRRLGNGQKPWSWALFCNFSVMYHCLGCIKQFTTSISQALKKI